MIIYDLSPQIHESMVVYKDKVQKKPRLTVTRTIRDGSNESKLEMESHTGSHADAPFHFLQKGKKIDEVLLEKFFGDCVVLDFCNAGPAINESHLKAKSGMVKKGDIVLLKSKRKQSASFDFDFTYLDKSGAAFLASLKINAVGIDSLGIERNQKNHETHKILLQKEIIIFEGLELARVAQGRYKFYGFPLKIKNADASPIRAVLVKE